MGGEAAGRGSGRWELWNKIMDQSRSHFEAVYARMNILLKREHERGESFYNQFLADVVPN